MHHPHPCAPAWSDTVCMPHSAAHDDAHVFAHSQAALAEISRVLKPGGIFVGTTFMSPTAPLGQLLGNDEIVQPLKGLTVSKQAVGRLVVW